MLKKFFEAISNFFSNLFGNKKDKTAETKSSPPPIPSPPPLSEIEDLPQDGSEIKPDTSVIVYNEHDNVIIDDHNSESENVPTTPSTTDTPTGSSTSGDTVQVENSEDSTSSTETGATQGAELPEQTSGEDETQTETETTEVPEPEIPKQQRYLWCLDNGHGKKTAGKRSPELESGERLFEYEFNRDIVGRIIKELTAADIAFFNVVPEVDVDNFLEGRVKRANEKRSDIPKIFLSVHSNAAPSLPNKWANPAINGIETWFYHRSKKGRIIASWR